MCEFLGFVGRHIMPQNPSAVPISQPVSLPSNEPNNLVNPNIPQSIYQPQLASVSGTINSGVPISSTINSMQPISGVGPHGPTLLSGHQQPPMSNLGPQHPLPVGQPMISGQHQQSLMGQIPFGAPIHMGQYGPQQIPSHQINPQPSAPNQLEQPKVEQPQVAELISFD